MAGLFPPPRNTSASALSISENVYPENSSSVPEAFTPLLTWYLLCLAALILHASVAERAPLWNAGGVQHDSSLEPALFLFVMSSHYRHDSKGAYCSLPGMFAD